MLGNFTHGGFVVYADIIEILYVVVDADSGDACFSDTLMYGIGKRFISDGIGKEDCAVEIMEIGEIENIEFACVVAWIAD